MTEQEIQLKADEFTAALNAMTDAMDRGAVLTQEHRSKLLGLNIDIQVGSGVYVEIAQCGDKMKLLATPKLKALAAEIVSLVPVPPNPHPGTPQ